jgi:hypothetical protein
MILGWQRGGGSLESAIHSGAPWVELHASEEPRRMLPTRLVGSARCSGDRWCSGRHRRGRHQLGPVNGAAPSSSSLRGR